MTTGKIKKNKARYHCFFVEKKWKSMPAFFKAKNLRTLKDDEQ
jgi:hypothetical protein